MQGRLIDWRVDPRIRATLLRGKEILAGTGDAQLLHAEVKCRPLDSQTCGCPIGPRDDPPSLLESLANVVPLRVLQGNCPKGFRFGGTLQVSERGVQDAARSKDYAPLDEILELANVPRPLIGNECRHRFRRNLFDLLTHPAGIDLDKMFHQRWNVFAAPPQRWQREGKHIQTIVEVAAKFVALHHDSQIPVGRGYKPNVHLVGSGAAQALELLLLQDTQQFGLQSRRNISHLVQEERPFICQFETTNLLRDSAGKSASLVAKKFAFQEIERNGGAIQLDE